MASVVERSSGIGAVRLGARILHKKTRRAATNERMDSTTNERWAGAASRRFSAFVRLVPGLRFGMRLSVKGCLTATDRCATPARRPSATRQG